MLSQVTYARRRLRRERFSINLIPILYSHWQLHFEIEREYTFVSLSGQVSTCSGRNQLPIFRCTEVQLRRPTRPLLDDVMNQNELTISIFYRPYVTMISIAVLKTDLKPVLLHFVSTFLNLIVQPNEVISNLFLSEMLFFCEGNPLLINFPMNVFF